MRLRLEVVVEPCLPYACLISNVRPFRVLESEFAELLDGRIEDEVSPRPRAVTIGLMTHVNTSWTLPSLKVRACFADAAKAG
jgi:hypothetical protein